MPALHPREPQLGRREGMRNRTELGRCSLVWHIPPVTHPDTAALDVLATALGGAAAPCP